MWTKVLEALLEGFAMTDPAAYMFYLLARRETERQAERQADTAQNRPSAREAGASLVVCRLREEASA
jgi:hypothetical protein